MYKQDPQQRPFLGQMLELMSELRLAEAADTKPVPCFQPCL